MLPADEPTALFTSAEEVFLAVTENEGLGALEVSRPANGAERYWLTIKQTLRMFFNSAKAQISDEEAHALIWETAESLGVKGSFDDIHHVGRPKGAETIDQAASGIDGQSNRLVILDPRRWTLLNGDDSKSRTDILRMFGLGPRGLVVDNAASCVIAAANTYQLRYSVQAAADVLTWKLVLGQVVEEDERAEIKRKVAESEVILRAKVKAAYRHFAYLIRKGDDLDVSFARFDDDKQTSLSGSDVWSALVLAHRAVGEFYDPGEKRRIKRQLSEVFLSALLDTFDRHLTPKDVVTSFYKDPRFPLVPALDDVRAAVFALIQPAEHAGEGTGGWELVDSVGTRLNVAQPAQLAVTSVQQQLRRVVLPVQPALEPPHGEPYTDPVSGTITRTEGRSGTLSFAETATTYSWYRVNLANRSITDEGRREALAGHLRWLASKLEDHTLDHQLLTMKYELMVATSLALAEELKSRAEAIDARSSVVEET